MGRLPGRCGAVAEWSKALAWKVSIRQNRIEGSNPSRSANSFTHTAAPSLRQAAPRVGRPELALMRGWSILCALAETMNELVYRADRGDRGSGGGAAEGDG